MRHDSIKGITFIVLLTVFAAVRVSADTLFDETRVFAAAGAAPPVEYSFPITTTDPLTVTVTDLKTPAAFKSLQFAVTAGDGLAGTPVNALVDPATNTASISLPGAASATGNYVVHVVGTPDAAWNFGSVGICVTDNTAPTPRPCIAADSETVATPTVASASGTSSLNAAITSTTAGTYTVTLTDDAFPAALQANSLTGGITLGGTIVTQLAAGTTTVTLAANTSYTLLLGAIADAASNAGLYAIQITDPQGQPILDRTIPVGTLAPARVVANPTAQALTLTLADEGYPAALGGLDAAVTAGGTRLAQLAAPGTVSIPSAPAGSLQVWTYALAGSGAGVYDVALAPSGGVAGASLLNETQVVQPTGASATASEFAYLVPGLQAGKTYTLAVTDFQFPSTLQATPTATIAQGGAALSLTATGTSALPATFTATASGNAIVLVSAQAPTNGSGIFDVSVVDNSGAAPQSVFDQTQGVGQAFNTRTITLGTSGSYLFNVVDLGFPAKFQSLDALLSVGGTVVGEIYGAGSAPVTVSPGQYQLTFIATPDAAAGYGLYSLSLNAAPPTVTLTANTSSVVAGQPVQLTWSSQSATACTASGATGWSGNEPVSGTTGVTITATSTLSLACTGPGGSTTQSVTVTATPPAGGSNGGGGSFDLEWLGLLGALFAVRRAREPAHR